MPKFALKTPWGSRFRGSKFPLRTRLSRNRWTLVHFFGIFEMPWGRATTSPNLVGLSSKTKKLRTWVHYASFCPQCVGCACPKPQNRSRSDNTPQHNLLLACFW